MKITIKNPEEFETIKITPDKEWQEFKEWFDKISCHCDPNLDYEHIFVEDGESKIIPKHHWICSHCGKVTQIG